MVPQRLIPFVMVDPWGGKRSVREAERLIAKGAREFTFHPPAQAFYPNEREFYPIYELSRRLGGRRSSTPARPQ